MCCDGLVRMYVSACRIDEFNQEARLTESLPQVTVASVEPTLRIVASRGVKLEADVLIDECDKQEYDMIVIPGTRCPFDVNQMPFLIAECCIFAGSVPVFRRNARRGTRCCISACTYVGIDQI